MVDTPGHVDFGVEVSKSLDSVEGAVILFDSARGVQAQTLSVFDKAQQIGTKRDRIANFRRGHKDDGPDDGEGIRQEGMGYTNTACFNKDGHAHHTATRGGVGSLGSYGV